MLSVRITKTGYSDLVVMSAELYEKIVRETRIDYVIYEAEKEFAEIGKTIEAAVAFDKLEKKHFG